VQVSELFGESSSHSEVQPPLTSDIPHVQLEAIVHKGLNIETLGGHDLGDVLIGQLLQNSGLSGVIQTQHEQASLLVGLRKRRTANIIRETDIS
jgi:hypothetical protein